MELSEFEYLFHKVLDEHHEKTSHEHCIHCEWVEAQMEKDKARKQMMNSIANTAMQWSVAGLLGACWYWIQTHFKS